MTQRLRGTLLLALLLIAAVAGRTWAQSGSQGTLTITVQDTNGAVVPTAKLVLQDTATNDIRQSNTLAEGTYSFLALNAGTYKLRVSKAGFKDLVFNSVIVHASRVTDLTAKLNVGGRSSNGKRRHHGRADAVG